MHEKRIVRSLCVFVLVAVFASTAAEAQMRHHDISLSYGLVTLDQAADIVESTLTAVLTLGTFDKEHLNFSGAPFLTYHYSANGRFGFGFAVGGYSTTGDLTSSLDGTGTFKETNYVGALEFDYRWILKKSFQMYSGAGAGVRIRKGTYTIEGEAEPLHMTKALPTFHLNLLGFRFGRAVGIFGEIGAGYKGIFNVGLNAQF